MLNWEEDSRELLADDAEKRRGRGDDGPRGERRRLGPQGSVRLSDPDFVDRPPHTHRGAKNEKRESGPANCRMTEGRHR